MSFDVMLLLIIDLNIIYVSIDGIGIKGMLYMFISVLKIVGRFVRIIRIIKIIKLIFNIKLKEKIENIKKRVKNMLFMKNNIINKLVKKFIINNNNCKIKF